MGAGMSRGRKEREERAEREAREYDGERDVWASVLLAYAIIRERAREGGEWWAPRRIGEENEDHD